MFTCALERASRRGLRHQKHCEEDPPKISRISFSQMGMKNTLQKQKNTLKQGRKDFGNELSRGISFEITEIIYFRMGVKNSLQKQKNTLKQGRKDLAMNFRAVLVLKRLSTRGLRHQKHCEEDLVATLDPITVGSNLPCN